MDAERMFLLEGHWRARPCGFRSFRDFAEDLRAPLQHWYVRFPAVARNYRLYCFKNVMNEASLLLTLEKLKDAMWIDALKCMFADESALTCGLWAMVPGLAAFSPRDGLSLVGEELSAWYFRSTSPCGFIMLDKIRKGLGAPNFVDKSP